MCHGNNANVTAALPEPVPPRRRARRRRVSISSDDDDDNDHDNDNGPPPSSNDGPSSHIVSLVSGDDDEPPLKKRITSAELNQSDSTLSQDEANRVVKKRRSRPKKVQKITGYTSLTVTRRKRKTRRKRDRNQDEGASLDADDGSDDDYQPAEKCSAHTQSQRSIDLDGDKMPVPIIEISDDDDDFEVEKGKEPPKPKPNTGAASRTGRFRVSPDERDELTIHSNSQQPIAERVRDFEVNSVVVSRQKRKQIRNWLEHALSGTVPIMRFLVLHGPSGCGKWTALRAVFREFKVEPIQWEPPIPPDGNTSVLGSLLESLEAFLVGTNYPTLPGLQPGKAKRRVVVLRDLPISLADSTYRRNQLQEILSGFIERLNVPAVCLFSDNAKGVARLMRLMGPNFVQKVFTIRVYAPSLTATRKALNLVVKNEGIKTTQKNIGELAEAANGDLRLALNALHLYGKGKRNKNFALSDDNGNDTVASIATKDGTLGTYHAVSKVLNNKKNEDGESKYDVEQILADAQADPVAFMGFLHQNYTDFFGDYEDAMHALEALSEADCLMKWQADTLNRNCLADCAASVATRAFMLHNTEPVRKGWRPIRGPEYFAVQNNAKEFKERVRAEVSTSTIQNRLGETISIASYPQVVTRATVLEQVAYAEKIGRFQTAPWHQNGNSSGFPASDDADIAMVDAEATAAKTEPLTISVDINSNSDRVKLDGIGIAAGNLVKEEDVQAEELEEEIEDWDSDVG